MSLLKKIPESAIVTEPFPHLVVENFLPEDLYRTLMAEFPTHEVFTQGKTFPPNFKRYLRAAEMISAKNVSPTLLHLVNEFLTVDHLREVLRLFGRHLLAAYPDFERRYAPLNRLRPRVRFRDSAGPGYVLLEAQFAYHTPAPDGLASEREMHLKLTEKIVPAFLFLRPDEDTDPGGETELYRIRPGKQLLLGPRRQIDIADLELVRRVPYRRNLLLMFLNTPWSVTRIAPRGPTRHPMQYFNFLFESPVPMYQDHPSATP